MLGLVLWDRDSGFLLCGSGCLREPLPPHLYIKSFLSFSVDREKRTLEFSFYEFSFLFRGRFLLVAPIAFFQYLMGLPVVD